MTRLKKLAEHAQGTILDVGCKQQHNPWLDHKHTTGFDLVKHNCKYTSCQQGNAEHLDRHFSPCTFDTIIAGEVIEHLQNVQLFLKGINHTLKPKGTLLLTTPSPYHWGNIVNEIRKKPPTKNHVNLWSPRHLKKLLEENSFKLETMTIGSGTRIPRTNITLDIHPLISYHIIYKARKGIE